ncbi:ABC transporter permease [Fidelibacter multiformis]|uniref:ABC transporter permease n=1 Tax=Fidelibacter multiformis TaxID=3377529 RepID=UPI0037DD295A
MWQNIRTILQWEYIHRVRSKAFILSIILPFIILALAIGPQMLAMKSGPEPEYLVLMCPDNALADTIENTFNRKYRLENNEPRYLFTRQSNRTKTEKDTLIRHMIGQDMADAVLTVHLAESDTIVTEIYYKNMGPDHISRIQSGLQDAAESYRMDKAGLNRDVLAFIQTPVKLKEYQLTEQGVLSGQNIFIRYMTPFVFMFVLIMGIITTSQSIISSIIEERTHKIVELLLSSVKPSEIMAGKILGMGLLGLTQIFIYMIILYLAGSHFLSDQWTSGLMNTSHLIWYFVFFILGYLMFSTIYVALGSLFDNERDAQQLGGILSLIALLPIYFISFMLEHPESSLSVILSYIPLITPLLMIARIGISTPPFWSILGMALYLVAWIVFLIWLSSRIFRLAVLMYGKRPTFQEILRWNRSLSR